MKKRERTDGRNLSRVKQWPSNEMVKAIDRIPMVCAPCASLLCSLSLYLLGSTWSLQRKLHRMQKPGIENSYRRSPTKHQNISPSSPIGFPIDTFESFRQNFGQTFRFLVTSFFDILRLWNLKFLAIFFFFFFSSSRSNLESY